MPLKVSFLEDTYAGKTAKNSVNLLSGTPFIVRLQCIYVNLTSSDVNLHGSFLLCISKILHAFPICELLLVCVTMMIMRMIIANIY